MQQVGDNLDSHSQMQGQGHLTFQLKLTHRDSGQVATYVVVAPVALDVAERTVKVNFAHVVEYVRHEMYNAGLAAVCLHMRNPGTGQWHSAEFYNMNESCWLPLVFQDNHYFCNVILEPSARSMSSHFNCAPQPASTSSMASSFASSYAGQSHARAMGPPAAAPTAAYAPPASAFPSSFASASGLPAVTSSVSCSSFCHQSAMAVPAPGFRQVTAEFCVPERPAQHQQQPTFKVGTAAPTNSFVPKHLCERKKLRAKVKSVEDLVQLNRAIDREIANGKTEARAMEHVCRELGLSRTRVGELRRMYKKMVECQNDPRFSSQIESNQVSLKTLQAVMKEIETPRGYAASPALRQSTSVEALSDGATTTVVHLEPLQKPEHLGLFKQATYPGISPRGVAMPVTPHLHSNRRNSSYDEAITDNSSPAPRNPTQLPLRVPSASKAAPGSGAKRSLDPAFVAGTSSDEHGPVLKRVFHPSDMPTTSTFVSDSFFAVITAEEHSPSSIERDSSRREITPLSFTTEETAFTNHTTCDNFPLSPRRATPRADDDDCREQFFQLKNPFDDEEKEDEECADSLFNFLTS